MSLELVDSELEKKVEVEAPFQVIKRKPKKVKPVKQEEKKKENDYIQFINQEEVKKAYPNTACKKFFSEDGNACTKGKYCMYSHIEDNCVTHCYYESNGCSNVKPYSRLASNRREPVTCGEEDCPGPKLARGCRKYFSLFTDSPVCCGRGTRCLFSHDTYRIQCCFEDCDQAIVFDEMFAIDKQFCKFHIAHIKQLKADKTKKSILCEYYPDCRYSYDECLYSHDYHAFYKQCAMSNCHEYFAIKDSRPGTVNCPSCATRLKDALEWEKGLIKKGKKEVTEVKAITIPIKTEAVAAPVIVSRKGIDWSDVNDEDVDYTPLPAIKEEKHEIESDDEPLPDIEAIPNPTLAIFVAPPPNSANKIHTLQMECAKSILLLTTAFNKSITALLNDNESKIQKIREENEKKK